MMISIPEQYYSILYVTVASLLCLITAIKLQTSSVQLPNKDERHNILYCVLLSVVIIVFFGFRPLTPLMGDTYYYYHAFNMLEEYSSFSLTEEWLWDNLNVFCKNIGIDYTGLFILTASIYVAGMLFICWKFMRNSPWIAFMFCISSFSFYGYGINGIRNGMACSLVLFAISFFTESKKEYIIGLLFLIIAYFIHRSTILPSLCLLISTFIIRKPNSVMKIWLFSILLSIIAGNSLGNLIGSTGLFEDKAEYFNDVSEMAIASQFSRTGFRWDFLLYSSVPIIFCWFLTHERNFIDRTYSILINTYILSNSFWIIVIRASYSNRFAYLSWFLYPIVIAYPLIRFKIWEKQGIKASIILIAYSAFTILMFFKG